jgi:hypothetical protein
MKLVVLTTLLGVGNGVLLGMGAGAGSASLPGGRPIFKAKRSTDMSDVETKTKEAAAHASLTVAVPTEPERQLQRTNAQFFSVGMSSTLSASAPLPHIAGPGAGAPSGTILSFMQAGGVQDTTMQSLQQLSLHDARHAEEDRSSDPMEVEESITPRINYEDDGPQSEGLSLLPSDREADHIEGHEGQAAAPGAGDVLQQHEGAFMRHDHHFHELLSQMQVAGSLFRGDPSSSVFPGTAPSASDTSASRS